jgi:hypothetical protein
VKQFLLFLLQVLFVGAIVVSVVNLAFAVADAACETYINQE